MDTLKELPTKKLGGFTETDSEIQFLENLFNEDCKCQALHHRIIDTIPCSQEVTHKYQSCDVEKLTCAASAKCSLHALQMHSLYRCGGCGRDIADCWIVTPI